MYLTETLMEIDVYKYRSLSHVIQATIATITNT